MSDKPTITVKIEDHCNDCPFISGYSRAGGRNDTCVVFCQIPGQEERWGKGTDRLYEGCLLEDNNLLIVEDYKPKSDKSTNVSEDGWIGAI